jgi:hypothetical protein
MMRRLLPAFLLVACTHAPTGPIIHIGKATPSPPMKLEVRLRQLHDIYRAVLDLEESHPAAFSDASKSIYLLLMDATTWARTEELIASWYAEARLANITPAPMRVVTAFKTVTVDADGHILDEAGAHYGVIDDRAGRFQSLLCPTMPEYVLFDDTVTRDGDVFTIHLRTFRLPINGDIVVTVRPDGTLDASASAPWLSFEGGRVEGYAPTLVQRNRLHAVLSTLAGQEVLCHEPM